MTRIYIDLSCVEMPSRGDIPGFINAAYDKAAREQVQIELANLKRVGMLAVKN